MKFYTTTKAAEKLGVHRSTALKWINSGKLKAYDLRRGSSWRPSYRVEENDIEDLRKELEGAE